MVSSIHLLPTMRRMQQGQPEEPNASEKVPIYRPRYRLPVLRVPSLVEPISRIRHLTVEHISSVLGRYNSYDTRH
jgi:hypothetical protein